MSARTFPIAAILSASTGIMVCEKFSDVHELIEHLAGGPVWTHQLPAAMDALLPGLVGQLPWLADIKAPNLNGKAECLDWATAQAERYGADHAVTEIEGGWGQDPIASLVQMVGRDRVIPVVVDGPS